MPTDWNRRRARWDDWKKKVNAELAKFGLKYAEGEMAKMTAKRVKVTVDGREQDVPAVPLAPGLKEALGLTEGRPWGQEVGAEWDEDERIDAQLRKANRKERMAQWKRQKDYLAPGEQKPGFAKSPEGDLDESVRCDECGMIEGHAAGCSRMDEFSNDMVGGNGMGLDEGDDEDKGGNECPECGAPPGHEHDDGCPLHPRNDGGEYEPDREMDEASDLDDEDDMDTLGDDVDSEACPGCGAKPGDGINPKCDDPLGCGYWKEFKASAEGPQGRSLRSMLGSPTEDGDEGIRSHYGEREGFETDGMWIENPFWDESGRDEVDPEEHYGDAFTKSALAKRLRWGESSDYDGLPLNESCMFDRFDTLVGHRSDGTFDDRVNEATKLRSLVKKVVREAWSTYDPKTGEETEHSVDDDDLKDLYTDKDEKKVHEMKLSVAGPAFGAAASDTDREDDDGDEDYKALTPRKVPEPEQSGTRVKKKKPKS